MPFLDELDALEIDKATASVPSGEPLMLPVDSIDEDANQPRLEFDDDPLRELADSIRERGVKQPVSVRAHASEPKRWVLNFGARRLRACKLAGRQDIPAFVDAGADTYDQVVENEQREGLKPLELALFMQRRLAAGDSQTEIARRLGKSRSYITFVGALIDAPDWLMDIYRSGRCQGMTELYELRHLHEANPEQVADWLRATGTVNRGNLQSFKASLQTVQPVSEHAPQAPAEPVLMAPRARSDHDVPRSVGGSEARTETRAEKKTPQGDDEAAMALWGIHDGMHVRLVLSELPAEDNHVFVLPDGAERRLSIAADQFQLLRVARLV